MSRGRSDSIPPLPRAPLRYSRRGAGRVRPSTSGAAGMPRPASPPRPARPEAALHRWTATGEIRRTHQASAFHGEGQCKEWARLRLAGARAALRRGLRLMRRYQLQAQRCQPQPAEPKPNEETVAAGRPGPM